jgi:hypothetical protein
MPLGELVRLNHYAVPAAVAMQPGALAQLRQHREVGLLPGIVFGDLMPAHAGDGGALRRTWKAARAGGARRPLRYILKCRWASSSVENAHQRYEATLGPMRR